LPPLSGSYPISFHLSKQYDARSVIGAGSYGIVCLAVHKPSGKEVAIKKIPFVDIKTCQQTFREMKLLWHFNHENIISLLDLQKPQSYETFSDDRMTSDLRVHLSQGPLSVLRCQSFTYQILRGLKFIHSANIMHRDIRPANILVNSVGELKICDFGLARAPSSENSPSMTGSVMLLAYCPPEAVLTPGECTTAVDIWSTGCTFAEMLSGQKLFKGRN
ncbi:hypothetical protein IFR05_017522, partial [Cadophora sp. M221]